MPAGRGPGAPAGLELPGQRVHPGRRRPTRPGWRSSRCRRRSSINRCPPSRCAPPRSSAPASTDVRGAALDRSARRRVRRGRARHARVVAHGPPRRLPGDHLALPRARRAPRLAPGGRRRSRPRAGGSPAGAARPPARGWSRPSTPTSRWAPWPCAATWAAPTACSRPRTRGSPRTTTPTCSSTTCAAASSPTGTACRGPTSCASSRSATGRSPRAAAAPSPAAPGRPPCASCARGPRPAATPICCAWPPSTCRSPSAAATATPAARGTASPSACATPTAAARSTTRATGATSSRTGRRCACQLPRLPRERGRQLRQRVDRRRLQPLPHHPRRHRLGGPRRGRPLGHHRLLGRSPDRLPGPAARGACAHPPRPAGAAAPGRAGSPSPTCPTGWPQRRAIARNPRATITFDHAADARSDRAGGHALGGDGKLLHDADGRLVHVTLLEKLLVPVLAKLGNLVLDGGIWMNTQRPEWNDANNALVGDGLSMVTLCQLRRHLVFLAATFEQARALRGRSSPRPSPAGWMDTARILEAAPGAARRSRRSPTPRAARCSTPCSSPSSHTAGGCTEPSLGKAAQVKVREAAAVCRLALELRRALHSRQPPRRRAVPRVQPAEPLAGRRARGAPLRDAGGPGGGAGRGAALAATSRSRSSTRSSRARCSGPINAASCSTPSAPCRASSQKNHVPAAEVAGNALLSALLEQGDTHLVARDVRGEVRFAGQLQTVEDVRRTVAAPRRALRAAGRQRRRSGAGRVRAGLRLQGLHRALGHHVRLRGPGLHLLAHGLQAAARGAGGAPAGRASEPPEVRAALARAYYRVRSGLGFNKSAEAFGAFPTDPYSHTPRHAGAQQPGMTGSVKEEILTRLGELGVEVDGRAAPLPPHPARRRGVLEVARRLRVGGWRGEMQQRALKAGELGFTLCQVPVVYRLGPKRGHTVFWSSGTADEHPGRSLDARASRAILGRTGEVAALWVTVAPDELLHLEEG